MASVTNSNTRTPVDTSSSGADSLSDQLSNSNAWKVAGALVLQACQRIAGDLNKISNEDTTMKANLMKEESQVEMNQATVVKEGSIAGALESGIGAAGEGVAAVKGIKGIYDKAQIKKDAGIKVADNKHQIDLLKNDSGIGADADKVAERKSKIEDLEKKNKDIKEDAQDSKEKINDENESNRMVAKMGHQITTGLSNLTQGQTEATKTTLQSASALLSGTEKEAEKNGEADQRIAQSLLQISPSEVAKASVGR